MFESILCQITEYDPDVLESLIELAVEIAREGREGRRVGTLFTLGDENAVLARSRALVLDPLFGHPESSRHLTNLNLRETIKELAQLDGGFVVSHAGIVLSACRYLDAVAAQVDVPLRLGSRHIAAANMSAVTKAVGIVGSESSVVRLFCHGQLVGEIIPELWMKDHAAHLSGIVKREQVGELTILTPSLRQAHDREVKASQANEKELKKMTTLQEFRCEVCGLVTTKPTHWFVIRCGDADLTVYRWNSETANAAGARHYCGEAHAEVYISRWFDSVCAPPKPSFK